MEHDEAEHADDVGNGEPEPNAGCATGVGLGGGEPPRADVRGKGGGDREQGHATQTAHEQVAVAARDAEPKVVLHGSSRAPTSSTSASPSRTTLARPGT